RAAWGAFKSIEDVVKRRKNTRLRANLFESTVFPVLRYVSETWSLRRQGERSLSVIERAVERTMLGVSQYTSRAKNRWAGRILRRTDARWTKRTVEWTPRECKRPLGRPPTRWA
ncbi:hypothetical protein Angca_009944, partial [Angiostrongylus cantonensis]